jgi:hypothetical protein
MSLYLRSPSGYFSFDVQQHFHDETIPASVLSYELKPIDGKQARFADRVAVHPSIDLSQYCRKAVVDWVEVWFAFAI